MGGGAGWGEEGGAEWGGVDGQKILARIPWSSHYAHTMAYATSLGHRGSGSILGPQHLIGILHWCHCSSCDIGG